MVLLILAIILGLFFVGSPVLIEFYDHWVASINQTKEDKMDAQNFGNPVVQGDVVCDLYIRIDSQLDSDRTKSDIENLIDIFASDDLFVYIDGSDILVEHNNCFTAGNQFASMLNFLGNAYDVKKLSFLSLLVPANDFEIEMTGKSKSTGKLLTEGITGSNPQKRWVENVKVSSEFFDLLIHKDDLPVDFTVEFFLDDVKNDDYTVEFVAKGKSINNQNNDKPYIYDLRKVPFA